MNLKDLDMQEFMVEKTKLVISEAFSEIALMDFDVRMYEIAIDRMVLEIKTYVTEHKVENLHVKYPVDWWQSFKDRWFNKWLLKWYPVKYREIHYKASILLPKLNIPNQYGTVYKTVLDENIIKGEKND